MPSFNIAFIGSGNLAWHLAPALDNTGYIVKEVYSRNPRNADVLVNRLYQANRKNDLNFSESNISALIICSIDDSIADISREVVLPDGCIVIHTSGSQPLSLLEYTASENFGVFYPLQTFTKSQKIRFTDIPIFVEGSNKETSQFLIDMGRALTKQVYELPSEDRKLLHLAAVFACNFANHFMKIADDILETKGFDLSVLAPLIKGTVEKALTIGPEEAQTGPAVRHDFEVLEQHLDLMEGNEKLQHIYKTISDHIIDNYPKE